MTVRRSSLLIAATLTVPAAAHAQDALPAVPSALMTAVGLAVLGLVPFVLVVTTSFAKFAVVLSILRSALGTQNVPPNMVLAALALTLSAYVMAPVFTDTAAVAAPMLDAATSDPASVDDWAGRLAGVAEPIRVFLAANAGAEEVALFAELRGTLLPDDLADAPLSVVVPAFAITELAEAFQLGFLLFLPFLLLDLLIGSVLLSLGMHMLSPTSVSMPFKLLLFVLVNGWITLSESLILGYTYPGVGG